MDGGKRPGKVTTAMEEEQLAAQRQIHLGCPIVARYCCPAREADCENMSYACPCTRVRLLKNIKTTSRWIRLLRLRRLRWIWTDNIRVNCLWLGRPMTPQAIEEDMQLIDGLVTERWT